MTNKSSTAPIPGEEANEGAYPARVLNGYGPVQLLGTRKETRTSKKGNEYTIYLLTVQSPKTNEFPFEIEVFADTYDLIRFATRNHKYFSLQSTRGEGSRTTNMVVGMD